MRLFSKSNVSGQSASGFGTAPVGIPIRTENTVHLAAALGIKERFLSLQKMCSLDWANGKRSLGGNLGLLGGQKEIGSGTVFNTQLQSAQLVMALALSKDKRIAELALEGSNPNPSMSIVQFLEKYGGALKGIRAIDLGCGEEPTFAMASRALGAVVYTIDVQRAGKIPIYVNRPEWLCPGVDIPAYHIHMDLQAPAAIETITNLSGGSFDLVTEAHLSTGTPHYIYDTGIAGRPGQGEKVHWYAYKTDEGFYSKLLRANGTFFAPSPFGNHIMHMRGPNGMVEAKIDLS
jgi:hypothetical protein